MSSTSFANRIVTKDQLKTLHMTRGRLEQLTGGQFNRDHYDQILIGAGNVTKLPPSSKDLVQSGFENVMAALEGELAKYDTSIGVKWRAVVQRRRQRLATDQQLHEIRRLHGVLVKRGGPPYALDAIAKRLSNHRVDAIELLIPGEASDVIEMLNAAIGRLPRIHQEAAQ